MKNITIQIPDMQSSHCQMRVSKAINSLNGVIIQEIKPGTATVAVENETQEQSVIRAINEAGYKTTALNVASTTRNDGETFHFTTNINCSNCVSKVALDLNATEGICHWEVDTNSKAKTLTVQSSGINPEGIIKAVKKAGFEIELINDK